MIIDSHQHFWNYDPIRDSWIDDSMSIIRKNFLPKDLEPILIENGVDGCIAVQADQSELETQFLIDCACSNSFIKGVVGWVDLTSKNIDNRLNHFSYRKEPCIKSLVPMKNHSLFLFYLQQPEAVFLYRVGKSSL